MSVTITTAPAVEPISTAEAKEWLRIDTGDTSQDAVLVLLIKGVRRKFEDYLRRSFITQTITWVTNADDISFGRAALPRSPVQSVTSMVTYDDSSGSEVPTTVLVADYQLTEGHLVVARNNGWVVSRTDRASTFVYVAGYGAASTDIPADIILAMLEMLALRFERRGDDNRDIVTSREESILESVDHYRLVY